MQRLPIIGKAVRKSTPKGEFINVRLNKAALMHIIANDDGNIRLTMAERKHGSTEDSVSYVVYEDDFIPIKHEN